VIRAGSNGWVRTRATGATGASGPLVTLASTTIDDRAAAVHDADARAFRRHVGPGIVVHGRPSMRHGRCRGRRRSPHCRSQALPRERITPGAPALG
jgi:hypothetical protein